ncbi:MAG: copper chaperone PCu(A)C [Xanthomonadaceae bacterium]|jgi:copper(I)-binding protein|nr:copper chaperone PCu(A)C [Xanthomonadaceae bacterium]
MNMKPICGWAAVLLAGMMCGGVQAAEEAKRQCEPVWEKGWIRLPPAPMAMLGGFGHIRNKCDQPMAIVSVSSPLFSDVSLHETRLVDGVSQMREVERLPVSPGRSVQLQPGGLHLMLMEPTKVLEENEVVPISLTLEDGRTIHGQLRVRKTAPR